MEEHMGDYYSIRWMDGTVQMLDQRLLPNEVIYRDFVRYDEVASAIRLMIIRGAPAIGIAAGFGLALAAIHTKASHYEELFAELNAAAKVLRDARPTAVNLFGAIERILLLAESTKGMDIDALKQLIVSEAQKIADEDIQMNKKIGMLGQQFIPDPANVIHHCNTGALATGGYGTALGVIRAAHENGKNVHVYVDETRPLFQGGRLTSWELKQLGIPHTVIVDGASGYFMRKTKIDACFVGCDRIASNGDAANKIGSYNLALAAYAHGVPYYTVGPITTIDLKIKSGDEIPIEIRPEREITHFNDCQITPDDIQVANPAFDITLAKYITAIITNNGIAFPPYNESLAKLMR